MAPGVYGLSTSSQVVQHLHAFHAFNFNEVKILSNKVKIKRFLNIFFANLVEPYVILQNIT